MIPRIFAVYDANRSNLITIIPLFTLSSAGVDKR